MPSRESRGSASAWLDDSAEEGPVCESIGARAVQFRRAVGAARLLVSAVAQRQSFGLLLEGAQFLLAAALTLTPLTRHFLPCLFLHVGTVRLAGTRVEARGTVARLQFLHREGEGGTKKNATVSGSPD